MSASRRPCHLSSLCVCLLVSLCLCACQGFRLPGFAKNDAAKAEVAEKKASEPPTEKTTNPEDASSQPPSVALSFLLSMNFDEAKAISGQNMDLPSGVRVAADSVEVIKLDRDNLPKRIRARGKVYLESGQGQDAAKILCQEALISYDEIILRGKPIVQRGGSIIEGLDDRTVAYMLGTRLRVIGLHRLTNQDTMVAMLPDLGPWTAGPNPILPPLEETSVPNDIREAMLKAAEAEAVLQQTRQEALRAPEAPPAPWIKDAPASKTAPPTEKKPTTEPKAKATVTGALYEKILNQVIVLRDRLPGAGLKSPNDHTKDDIQEADQHREHVESARDFHQHTVATPPGLCLLKKA